MKRMVFVAVMMGGVLAVRHGAAEEARVEGVVIARHAASGLTVISGQVILPGKGEWLVPDPSPTVGPLTAVILEAPDEVIEAGLGQRGQVIQQERRAQAHLYAIRGAYWPLARWARAHGGRMPTLTELDEPGRAVVERAFSALPVLPGSLLNAPAAPHAALVPSASFEFEKPRYDGHDYVRGTNELPILVELHPLQDDGKHYVLRANARLEREIIDPVLMATLGLTVTPLTLDPAAAGYPETASYRLLAQVREPGDTMLLVSNALTGVIMEVLCPSAAGAPDGGIELLLEWAGWREDTWQYLAESYDAPGVRTWAWLQQTMFRGKQEQPVQSRRNRRNRGESTDMMGVLGGRAALRETLQLEALQVSGVSDAKKVPLETIEGVVVQSHPFEAMLGGTVGNRYPMANYVPHDRFFLGVSKPKALLPLLDDGAAFLARVGAGITGRALQYDLKQRYLQDLGVSESLVRTLVQSGAIKELAIFSPDLYFVDGADVTAIVRMNGAAGLKPLLRALGISLKEDAPPVRVETPGGGELLVGARG